MQNMKYEVLLKMMSSKTKAEEVKKKEDGYPCRREKTVPTCGGTVFSRPEAETGKEGDDAV